VISHSRLLSERSDILERLGLGEAAIELDPLVRLHEPFPFSEFVALVANARCVGTDSGTVQEACSLLKVPTVTCRDSIERPETVECGSNLLCGVDAAGCLRAWRR
jgi:UDP-N-acetylglucosamine 2-epimerase (non-hydrolysing)